MRSSYKVLALLPFAVLAVSSVPALAQGPAWTKFSVYNFDSGKPVVEEFKPAAKPKKKWNLCALVPNMADSYWTAVDYGLVREAKRLGVKLTIYQAGGYSNMSKQISQYDDCATSGADAILIAPISASGLANKIAATAKTGKVQIGFVNQIKTAPVTSKIFVNYATKGFKTGKFLAKKLGSKGGGVVAFPGPQNSGWAEAYMKGFENGVKGSKVKILAKKYGPANVAASLNLVEDALQSYPNIKGIWGGAPAAEAAIDAVQEAGVKGVTIVSSYGNQTMVDSVKSGKIAAFATEFPVMQGRVAVDLAVEALEGKKVPKHLGVIPKMVTAKNIRSLNLKKLLAPKDFHPIFSVN